MYKFTIIIPVYNVEKYLSKCLDSLINQTYKNIEIICINDGSTDNSLQILNEYARVDSRVIVINQENQGVSAARNKGLSAATGDYVLFVDSDDWVELILCETLANKLDLFPYDLISFNYYAQSKQIRRVIRRKNNTKEAFFRFGTVCSYCFNKNFLMGKNIKFNNNLKMSEDMVFKILVLLNNPTVGAIDLPLYYYFYTRENSATKNYKDGIYNNIKSFEYLKSTQEYKNASDNLKLLIVDIWSTLIFGLWASIPCKDLNSKINNEINNFLLNYNIFNKKDYKNLTGYKRLKYKHIIRLLKNIRDIIFNIIYRRNNEK